MTHEQNMIADALSRGAIPGRGYRLARLISQILHPIPLALISLITIGTFGIETLREGFLWALVTACLQIIPPMIFFVVRLRQGAYTDDDVSDRTQRNELYFFGIINLLVGLLLLNLFDAPLPFRALVAAAALVSAIAWAINLTWKISVHAASMGSTATIAAIYYEPLGLMLWICAIILGWARVRTRNHTPMQVIAGLALATVGVLVTFMAFGLR
ncbi:MAG: phosphatase PAP2 family protein [Candidatus Viridilinea halotolerans]|uniref:Phosphatase PAP2 family protein n=1 Tax=Candidatus Viridilinea halotolerans TaxID=2491704 RepID=A0A426U0F5_9CHLR|nr:MAG: phosphatase PAP2 family protein [Candidatus Viridilinea halotolerans]